MNSERRNDIGSKLGVYLILFLIGALLTIFFTGTYNKAEEANTRAQGNSQEIAVQRQCITTIQDDVKDVRVMQRVMDDKIDAIKDAVVR